MQIEILHPALQQRYRAWSQSSAAHPDLIAALTQIQQGGEPWLDVATIYVLEAETAPTLRRLRQIMRHLNRATGRWRRLWQEQGRPSRMVDLFPGPATTSGVTLGCALDRAIAADLRLRDMLPVAQMLLPDRYLKSMGWRNLPIPQPLMRLLLRRSGSPSDLEVPAEHRELVKFLSRHRSERHFLPLICAAICMLGERSARGERNAPQSVLGAVAGLHYILQTIWSTKKLMAIKEMLPRDIKAYEEGTFGGPKRNTRLIYIMLYVVCWESQQRFRYDYPDDFRIMTDHALPHLPKEINLQQLNAERFNQQRNNRRSIVDRIMPHYIRLIQVTTLRAAFFHDFRNSALAALKSSTSGQNIINFSLPLPDQSALLNFRWVLLNQIEAELQNTTPHQKRQKVSLSTETSGHYLVQYIGAEDQDGNPKSDMPFFARIFVERYTHQQIGNDGISQSDLRRSIIFPPGQLGAAVTRTADDARRNGCPTPLLFDLDSLCGGVAIGALVLLIATASGMRAHEMQQIRLDDGRTLIDETGAIAVQVQPKAHKRDRAMTLAHRIDPYLLPYWRHLVVDLASARGPWALVTMQHGDSWQIPPGQYLFQWRGAALRQSALNALLRLVTIGILPDLSVTTHLLRHCYARSGIALGQARGDVQHALGHHSPGATSTYTAGAVAGSDLQIPTPLTTWEALIYDAQDAT